MVVFFQNTTSFELAYNLIRLKKKKFSLVPINMKNGQDTDTLSHQVSKIKNNRGYHHTKTVKKGQDTDTLSHQVSKIKNNRGYYHTKTVKKGQDTDTLSHQVSKTRNNRGYYHTKSGNT